MAANPESEHMSVEDYLALLERSEERYEYSEGVITMMSGGTVEHAEIAINLLIALRGQFLTGPCRVYNSDMAVQVRDDKYYFPDITISCDMSDHRRGNRLICSPHGVFEVLSDSTELKDRSIKLRDYQACPTIQEYVLISSREPLIEIYAREDEDSAKWRLTRCRAGEVVFLESMDVSISLEDIYRGVF